MPCPTCNANWECLAHASKESKTIFHCQRCGTAKVMRIGQDDLIVVPKTIGIIVSHLRNPIFTEGFHAELQEIVSPIL